MYVEYIETNKTRYNMTIKKHKIGTIVRATLDCDGAKVVSRITGYEGTLYGMTVYQVIEIAGDCVGNDYSIHHGEITSYC